MKNKIDFPENTNFVGVGSLIKFNNGLNLLVISTGFNSVGTAIVENKGYIKVCPVHNKNVNYVTDLHRLTETEFISLLSTYTVNVKDIIEVSTTNLQQNAL